MSYRFLDNFGFIDKYEYRQVFIKFLERTEILKIPFFKMNNTTYKKDLGNKNDNSVIMIINTVFKTKTNYIYIV